MYELLYRIGTDGQMPQLNINIIESIINVFFTFLFLIYDTVPYQIDTLSIRHYLYTTPSY